MGAYYNENDPFAAAWLRELIKANLIAPGEVDERSIADVEAGDLKGFRQCHFFAGVGGWSLALRLARWPREKSVWTGSCPCQPWSLANVWQGGGKGHKDERDLWPHLQRLILQRKPPTFFGEQVTGAIRWGWLDRAFSGMEAEGYACGATVLPAYAVGAKHQRNRVYFVADSRRARWQGYKPVKRFSFTTEASFSVYGDTLAGARNALAGDYGNLLPCDGLSVQMERDALKGYGNAIVPQVAREFIEAYLEVKGF